MDQKKMEKEVMLMARERYEQKVNQTMERLNHAIKNEMILEMEQTSMELNEQRMDAKYFQVWSQTSYAVYSLSDMVNHNEEIMKRFFTFCMEQETDNSNWSIKQLKILMEKLVEERKEKEEMKNEMVLLQKSYDELHKQYFKMKSKAIKLREEEDDDTYDPMLNPNFMTRNEDNQPLRKKKSFRNRNKNKETEEMNEDEPMDNVNDEEDTEMVTEELMELVEACKRNVKM